jgi:hypothetical protein
MKSAGNKKYKVNQTINMDLLRRLRKRGNNRNSQIPLRSRTAGVTRIDCGSKDVHPSKQACCGRHGFKPCRKLGRKIQGL